jgi:tetratricopeptide (TPR) repeat protein
MRPPMQQPASRILGPGERIGVYVLHEVIGQGAMGVVYRAHDPRLDRAIALKVVNPTYAEAEARARLLEEARALARLSHPNVVSIFDAGVEDERVYLAMELVEGTDVAAWLRSKEPAWREVLDVFLGAAAGLRAAHAAGIVHRDFKPSNVLLGRDGRARVVDFGIARALTPAEPTSEEGILSADVSNGTEPQQLTRDGMVMGTPAFMAPEQHYGHPVTPAADQFAFCVSLYQGLYGRLPFTGRAWELVAAKRRPLSRPADDCDVPGALFEIVARGLHHDPQRRFASMGELAGELRRVRPRTRRWLVPAIAGVAAITLPLALSGSSPCRAKDRTSGAWSPAVGAEIERAFEATDQAYASDAWRRTETALDGYFGRWRSTYDAACRSGEREDDGELDHTMACLDARLRDAEALVEVLRDPDAATVRSAVEAARSLAPPEACSDPALWLSAEPIPVDAALREPVQAIRDELRRAATLERAGRYPEGVAIAGEAVAEAERTGFAAVQAEAWEQLASLQDEGGSRDLALQNFERAYYVAAEIGHDIVATKAALGLAWVHGERRYEFAPAHRWAELARASLERAGGDRLLSARLHNTLGALASSEGRRDEALVHYARVLELVDEHDPLRLAAMANSGNVHSLRDDETAALEAYAAALAIAERELGPDHPKTAQLHDVVGNSLRAMGRLDEAVVEHEIAVATLERAVGPEHPDLARPLTNLARTVEKVGDVRRAVDLYLRALALEEANGDETLASVTLTNIGNLLVAAGYYDAARTYLRRSLELHEKLFGPAHPEVGYPLVGLGTLAEELGLHDEALVHYERALAASRARPDLAARIGPIALDHIASVLERRGQLTDALERYREALAGFEVVSGEASVDVAVVLVNMSETLLLLQRNDEARRAAERAMSILGDDGGWADLRGEAELTLAEALWSEEEQRPRALRLARRAVDDFQSAGDLAAADAARARAWLVEHDPNAP